eukprot:COSAG05_NODE_9_length_39734_cov_180.598067_27_plen_1828_part_00
MWELFDEYKQEWVDIPLDVEYIPLDVDYIPRYADDQASFGQENELKPPGDGVLTVKVVRAAHLIGIANSAWGDRTSDPYVVLNLASNTYKSSAKQSTCNPEWNEAFRFRIAEDMPLSDLQLRAEVLHWNNLKQPGFLGYCEVDLPKLMCRGWELNAEAEAGLPFQLKDPHSKAPKKGLDYKLGQIAKGKIKSTELTCPVERDNPYGAIRLSFKFDLGLSGGPRRPAFPGTVCISRIDCDNLIAVHSGGTSDPYVIIKMGLKGKKLTTKKTNVEYKNLNPRWVGHKLDNFRFLVNPDLQAEDLILRIEVWAWNSMGTHSFLGGCRVDMCREFEDGWDHNAQCTSMVHLSDPDGSVSRKHLERQLKMRHLAQNQTNEAYGTLRIEMGFLAEKGHQAADRVVAKDKFWKEMSSVEQSSAIALGWSEADWDAGEPAPFCRDWASLNVAQQRAAETMGFGARDFNPHADDQANDTFREQLAATLKAAEQDGVEWMRSKIMYVGDGRAGKSHLHKNVAGEPPLGAIDSTVGMDTLTLECKAMQTGGKAGTWSRYTCNEDVGQALQALATAGAAMELGQVNPDYGSMSDNVDGWLAQPDSVDSAVAAASLGNMLATVLPLDDDLMQLDSTPPVPTAPVQKSQSASTLDLERAPASGSKFELQRRSRVDEPEPEQEQSLHAKTPSLSSERKSFTPEPEEPEPEPEEPEPEPESEPWVGRASEMEDVIKMIPGCKKAWDSLILEGWDLGGQRIFYTLHHLYMTRYSIYCVLFDMRQLLPTAAKNVRTNALTVLRFWLNSIVVHTASNTEDDSCAPLVIVGTHKDLVPSPQDHMAISKVLYETFGTHPAWPSLKQNRTDTANPQDGGQKTLLWFFPLDNLAGSADPVFSAFLSTVETAVREEKYVHQRVPIAWYRMYDKLQTLLLGGQPTVTFLDAVELANTAGLPVDPGRTVEKELRAFLCFLHELGILMYFDEPGLNAVIVLDPQWLVTAATKIICEFSIHDLPEHRVAARQHARSWNALLLKSELHVELLAALWPEHNTQTQRQLLQLMTKFGLITPQRDRAKFLVPSLLRDTEELERQMQRILETGGAIEIQHTAYFVFSLRNQLADDELVDVSQLRALGFLPVGFFPRILGKCVEWSQSTHGAPPILSPSRGIIAFGADRFMLTELQECNAIRLELFQDNVGACERVSTLIKEVIAECMPQLCSELMLSAPADGDDTSLAHLLPLGLIRVAASTDGDQSGLWTGHRQMIQNELQAEYSLWLPSVGQLRGYDIMLSYRHQGVQDTECALKINDGCSSGNFLFGTRRRHLRVFLDAIRLSTGSQFMEDIMKAMLRSRVVCPIVSASATQRMETWRPDGERDCVLVEWLLAIELKRLGKVLTVLPILLGELTGGGRSMHNFFNRRDVCGKNAIDRLPNAVPTVEIAIVDRYLRENNLQASPELATRTIRQTVESLVRETLRIDTWEFCGDGELDIHGSRAAAAAAAATADSEGNMYEQCTAQVALAAQKTLEQRSEAQDDMEDARALSKDVEYHMTLPPGLVNHFFLSHKQANGGPTVAWLEAKFTLRRLLSWYDNNADDRSEQGMMDGVRGAAVFVLFLTAGTIERYYVQLEIREAFRLRKPIIMIMETDERFGKPDFAAEMAAKLHVDSNTNVPIVSKQQISWLFSEVTAIPVRRQAHELPAFLDEVERQTRVIIEIAGGKRPPTELMSGSVSELAQPEPEPEVQTSPPASPVGKTAEAVPIPEGIPSPHATAAGDAGSTVAWWLRSSKLQMCEDALAEVGYDAELDMIVDGDEEEVAYMLAAVEGIAGIKLPVVKKFKRELAKIRAKGETFK